jgi:hypothetical protein
VAVSPHVISTVSRFVVKANRAFMLTKIKTITLALSLILFVGISVFAQGQGIKLEEIDDYDKRTFNCEIYSAAVDIMTSEYSELIGKSDFLVLIARLGKGETNRKFNLRRLHNVRARIEARGIDPKKFVVAEGEKVSGLGRVEVFAGGKLIEVFSVNRNRDICVECCGPDDRFYPDRDELDRKQRQKPKRKRRG